jgi:hypothetical protein
MLSSSLSSIHSYLAGIGGGGGIGGTQRTDAGRLGACNSQPRLFGAVFFPRSQENMAAAQISFDHVGLDSINQVTCGLMSYCIDAKGAVSECSLPWLATPARHLRQIPFLLVAVNDCLTFH